MLSKKVILTIMAAVGLIMPAVTWASPIVHDDTIQTKEGRSPDIGATVETLTARYGKVLKVDPAWCGGTAYGFMPSKARYIYAIISPGRSTVSDVMYIKLKGYGDYGVGLWDKDHSYEMKALFDQNKTNNTWDMHTVFVYNGIAWYQSKAFGNKLYWFEQEAFGTKNLVGTTVSESENGPANGFQVRTFEQFQREEKAVRKLQGK